LHRRFRQFHFFGDADALLQVDLFAPDGNFNHAFFEDLIGIRDWPVDGAAGNVDAFLGDRHVERAFFGDDIFFNANRTALDGAFRR
jgi:hypothetical protein